MSRFEERGSGATITGTWINLFYQDVRNEVTNPDGVSVDWDLVVSDMHQMGIELLIILAVANEGVAAYPSALRPVEDSEGKSAVEQLMEAAARFGMRVYLSTGWVDSQFDDPGNPETLAGQIAIMDELAVLYGSHPAFEGWYLPCEDSVAPRLSDRTIDGVNTLSRAARSRTPNAKILISPYFPHAAVVDDQYVDSLSRVEVDAVAYQDGVGCAYTISMADQYQLLREAHRKTGVAMWANVESFAWRQGIANSHVDALVPAAFPRLHSQLFAAGEAGVERTVSFAVQALMQDREMVGIGDGEPSLRLRHEYEQYLEGSGRWPVLEAWNRRQLSSLAAGLDAECLPRPVPGRFGEPRLTDGRRATENPMDAGWVRFTEDAVIRIDLSEAMEVGSVVVSFLHARMAGVVQPRSVRVLCRENDEDYQEVGIRVLQDYPYDQLDIWHDIVVIPVGRKARVLELQLERGDGYLLVDQILVLPPEDARSLEK